MNLRKFKKIWETFWKTTVWENKEKHLEIILNLCIKNLGEIGLKLAILGHFLSC